MSCQVMDAVCPNRKAGLQTQEHSPHGTSKDHPSWHFRIFPVVLATTALIPRRHSVGCNFPKQKFASHNDREFRAPSGT